MGIIVKAIGTGVGFIAEATSSNKNKSTPDASFRLSQQSSPDEKLPLEKKTSQSSSSDDTESDYDSGDDESNWVLDEEASKVAPIKKSHDFQGQVKVDSLIDMVLSMSKPPPYDIPSNGLPVILPQRRPGARGRGFVRAYAPTLSNYGIDQDTFLTFIENFDDAIKASPALNVVYLGAGIAGFVPHGYAMLASAVASVVVGAAIEYQRRSRGNAYMDQLNEKLFKPRGLYAVVMTYIPNAQRPVTAEQTDFNALVNGTAQNGSSILGAKLQKGESYGELELPESAPLVFPGLDEATRQKILDENALKRGSRWTQDYMDRREQARWLHNNPNNDVLNPTADGQKPTFNSSLADPMHPAFQGSWPTLFSGGRIAPKQKASKEEKRARKEMRREEKRARKGKGTMYTNGGYTDAYGQSMNHPNGAAAGMYQPRPSKKQQKKMAKSKVLYLMILPLPSQSELREINQQMADQKMIDMPQ